LARGDKRDSTPRHPIKLRFNSKEILDKLIILVRGHKNDLIPRSPISLNPKLSDMLDNVCSFSRGVRRF